MKKSKFLIFLIIGVFCVFGVFGVSENVEASASHNVFGWAWSDNIGWISFNNDTDGSAVDYGVNINDITGEFSGHAWSDNAGWISFERAETGVPPEAPYNGAETYIAELIGNDVFGWAKVLSSDSWIRLSNRANDDIGVFIDGAWHIDYNRDGVADDIFSFGGVGDIPVVGDFDSDGYNDDIGVFIDGAWHIDYNHNTTIDESFWFGAAGHIPIVADFDSDGYNNDIGVFIDGAWHIDYNRDGVADDIFSFGGVGDIPVVGDFDSDGYNDDIGVFIDGAWHIDYNHNTTIDESFWFGAAGHIPIVADFDSDGYNNDIGVFIDGAWHIDYNRDGVADDIFSFGGVGDIPVVGDFDDYKDDVSIDVMGDFHNYAWSDDYGWISFNCAEGGPGGADICGTSNYKVSRTEPIPPPDFNVYGFAWSDSIGWVSFNYDNCDENHDGVTDQGNYSQCPIGESVRWYGVDIDEITGELSGFAWSDKVGWIMFDPLPDHDTVLYPGAPQNSVEMDLNSPYKLTGWARACAGTVNGDCASATQTDGWDGWIKLSKDLSDSGGDYSVYIDPSPDPTEFRGSAWGSDVIENLSFNCIDGGTCGSVDYKVYTTLDFIVAEATDLTHSFDNPCYQSRIPTLFWKTNVAPFDYELQILDGASILVEETGNIGSTDGSWSPSCQKCCDSAPYNSVLYGGNTYNWKIRVKSQTASVYSDWVTPVSPFTTFVNCYPNPNFTIDPENPVIGDEIQLCSAAIGACAGMSEPSICYNPGHMPVGCNAFANFLWVIPEIPVNGSYLGGTTNIDENPEIEFTTILDTFITLEITAPGIIAGSGNCAAAGPGCCAITKSVSSSLPLPEWWEISPSF